MRAKHILQKEALMGKINTIKSSLNGQNIYYEK